MKVLGDMAQRLIRIKLPKCLLILTGEEYARAILRGKMERRREANERRIRGEGNILEVLREEKNEL